VRIATSNNHNLPTGYSFSANGATTGPWSVNIPTMPIFSVSKVIYFGGAPIVLDATISVFGEASSTGPIESIDIDVNSMANIVQGAIYDEAIPGDFGDATAFVRTTPIESMAEVSIDGTLTMLIGLVFDLRIRAFDVIDLIVVVTPSIEFSAAGSMVCDSLAEDNLKLSPNVLISPLIFMIQIPVPTDPNLGFLEGRKLTFSGQPLLDTKVLIDRMDSNSP
jgi:hypothetical protein